LSLPATADALHAPLICLYAPQLAIGTCRLDSLDDLPALSGLPASTELLLAGDAASALQSAAVGFPGRPVLLLAANAALPAYTALRLLRLGHSNAIISAVPCSELQTGLGEHGQDHTAPATLDRLCWLAGDPQPLPWLDLNLSACRLPAAAVPELAEACAIDAQPQAPANFESAVYTRLCVPGEFSGHASLAVQALALRLAPLSAEPVAPGFPGLDGRPVLLHVLHGWGGGSARFVEDFIQGDDRHAHLLLQADSDSDRRLTGVALCLKQRPGGIALRRQTLAAPIATTALRSRECAEMLESLSQDFGIAGVLVSSLIGLSLDVLRTGLPTAVVCHDYHPLWPNLHTDFGGADFDPSDAALAASLVQPSAASPFAAQPADTWLNLRQAYIAALLAAKAQLIAPTRAVLDNTLRLAPALAELPRHCIAHGLADWSQPAIAPEPPPRERLRVLVPGRINGGKGEQLLVEIIPQLPEGIELVLLGCGAAGMRFFGADRVHIVLDYRHDELPQHVHALAPDLALLPASVAETFSYTLSELWSLRLPVLATRIGSYAERIEQGKTGLLVNPDAASILRALSFIAQNRAPLQGLRRSQPRVHSLASMAAAYAERLAFGPRSAQTRRFEAVGIDCELRAQQLEQHRLQEALSAAQRATAAALVDSERRAQWARDQEKLAGERTLWAQRQQVEIDALTHQLELEQLRVEQELQRLADAQRLLEQLLLSDSEAELLASESESSAGDHTQLENTLALLSNRIHETAAERTAEAAQLRSWVAALQQQRDEFESERNQILQSSSWKLTRPLRGIRRLIERAKASFNFRRQRASSLLSRGLRSLRSRGLNGTVQRIKQEVRPVLPGTVLAVPASAPFAPFALPCADAPRVSVIIPVYNHLDHTLTCLRSILAQPSRIAAEIIVVDDCSSDASAETLPQIDGLRYQRNPENLGFIGACNAGAASARGEYLVFLNNDTAVQPGWLDALIDTFEQHDKVGLVGAKLIYPDGRLQEAGGIVFNDASGWNYGRFQDPAAPEYNYLREVDYCSGAAIAVPAELFNRFGGFDTHYAPAYYEDTDLAMKVWASGLRVLYQPKSAVVHFEGISSGTDTSTGIKAYQVVNQQKFLARWGERLRAHPAPGTSIENARQHRDARRVLIIDATTPAPDQDSGSLRMVNLMQVLRADGCAVSFFADNRAWVERYTDELQQLGVEVLWHPFLADVPGWFAEHGKRFDLIVLSRHYIAVQYMELVRQHAPQAQLVFDTVDLHYLREQREAELADRDDLRRQAAQTRDKELDLIRRSDVTLVVSPVEQALLASEAPQARVDILSNVHEVYGCRRSYRERNDLVFMGGYQHTPNVDAVLWFADEILPLIRAEAPEITFHVVGSKAPDSVRALGERPGISFHGFVPDIAPFMDNCRLAVAPLRFGAGVKGKVNMSMSYGQPVVATPIAIEGMHAEAGRDVLIADTPEAFAEEVLRAYRDPELWQQLSEHGLANVEAHFSFEAARGAVRGLFRS
jgi:GT2 family glycosyltransferase/glycosyltransferase involved in cell wall biosynthesis